MPIHKCCYECGPTPPCKGPVDPKNHPPLTGEISKKISEGKADGFPFTAASPDDVGTALHAEHKARHPNGPDKDYQIYDKGDGHYYAYSI